jgi:hypothetical protein
MELTVLGGREKFTRTVQMTKSAAFFFVDSYEGY